MFGSNVIRQLALFTALFASGCAGKYRHTIDLDPNEPLRVAVLPFVQTNSAGELVTADGKLLLDNVPVLSAELKENPPELVQRLVAKNLESSNLEVVSPVLVERRLSHSSFRDQKGPGFSLKQMLQADPRALCELLSCDALLYGKVTRWDRSYYIAQSINTVGVELKMVSARTGRTIFSATAEDSDSRGLTKGPTGFSSLVIEPIRGLDSAIIEELAGSVVKRALSPLVQAPSASSSYPPGNSGKQPERLPPPSIMASAHDSISGVVTTQHPLTVLALGSPGMAASFSVGAAVENIPMTERDPGHYIGEFYPLPTDSFRNQHITVYLSDAYGRTTSQRVARGQLSTSR